MRLRTSWIAAASLLTLSCGGNVVTVDTDPTAMADLASIAVEDWEWLAQQKIFFGHQSVGRNIMGGLQAIVADRPELELALVNSETPGSVAGPAFVEASIGRNGDPDSKLTAFERAVDGLADSSGIAMLKYCYADITAGTNVQSMFHDYKTRIEELKARHPGVTVVHFTLPLRTSQSTWKDQVKGLLGRPTQVALNARRGEYNRMLHEHYGASEPIFDLARLESTRADGTRSAVKYLGKVVYTLAPEWTDDGGHLNAAAQRRVAEQLLVFLAGLRPDDDTGSIAAGDAAGERTAEPAGSADTEER